MTNFEVERRSVMMSFTNDLVATLFALDALCLLLATKMRLDSFSASWTHCKLPKSSSLISRTKKVGLEQIENYLQCLYWYQIQTLGTCNKEVIL